jgi:hypothetical protein
LPLIEWITVRLVGFRKRMAPSQQRDGTTGKRKRFSALHAETKQDTGPEEDHSQRESVHVQTIGLNAEKIISAPSRWGDFSLDIPFYRTSG